MCLDLILTNKEEELVGHVKMWAALVAVTKLWVPPPWKCSRPGWMGL